MKVAILSESPADEEAIRILVEGVLNQRTFPVSFPPLLTRGWRGVLKILPSVLKHLHYRTDAEALVVSVDSDESPMHREEHKLPGGADGKCRLCQLQLKVISTRGQLRPRFGRPGLKIAIGVAVPAIEAWYRSGLDPRVSETAWMLGLQSKSYPYTKLSLKKDVYGTERPSLALETKRATEEVERFRQQHQLEILRNLFPVGFGSLVHDIRGW